MRRGDGEKSLRGGIHREKPKRKAHLAGGMSVKTLDHSTRGRKVKKGGEGGEANVGGRVLTEISCGTRGLKYKGGFCTRIVLSEIKKKTTLGREEDLITGTEKKNVYRNKSTLGKVKKVKKNEDEKLKKLLLDTALFN